MITNVVTSAARVALAPARLAGRIAGSLARDLGGTSAEDTPSAPPRTRTKPAARSRAKARPKRSASRSSAKAPRRAASRTHKKSQPRQPDMQSRARAQAEPAPRPKPVDDATIAEKVESVVFRGGEVEKDKVDVNVAERIVRLSGAVGSSELVNDLEARAASVAEVRRVENLLVVSQTPAGDTPAPQREPSAPGQRLESHAVVLGEAEADAPTPGPAVRSEDFKAAGEGRGPAEERDSVWVVDASGTVDSPAKSEDIDQLAEQDDSEAALDENPAHRPGHPALGRPDGD